MVRIGVSLVVVAVLATSGLVLPGRDSAWAQEMSEDLGTLNEKAKQLAKSGRLIDAAALWRRGFFLAEGEDELKIAKNLGIAYYKLGEYEPAFYFLSFFALRCSDPTRTAKVQKAAADLTAKLSPGRGKVGLNTVPQGATVYVDERLPENRYKTPVVWYFAPGQHRFIVEGEGDDGQVSNFMVREGDLQVFEVTLDRAADGGNGDGGTTDGGTPIGPPPVNGGEETDGQSPWPWALMGAGLVIGGVGGYYEYRALDERDAIAREGTEKMTGADPMNETQANEWMNGEFDDRVVPNNNTAIGFFVGGGLAVAGGVAWLLLEDRDSGGETTMSLVPLVVPHGAGVGFGMGF